MDWVVCISGRGKERQARRPRDGHGSAKAPPCCHARGSGRPAGGVDAQRACGASGSALQIFYDAPPRATHGTDPQCTARAPRPGPSSPHTRPKGPWRPGPARPLHARRSPRRRAAHHAPLSGAGTPVPARPVTEAPRSRYVGNHLVARIPETIRPRVPKQLGTVLSAGAEIGYKILGPILGFGPSSP